MNFKWWLKYTIKVLITPSCWIRNYRTSKIWDKQFLKLLEENNWERTSVYTAYIGSEEVWISNHPYASFFPYRPAGGGALPSRKTVLYAMDRLVQDLLGGN